MYMAVFLCLIVSRGSPPWSSLRGSISAILQICLYCPHLALKNPPSQMRSLRLDPCAVASHHSVQTLLEIIQSRNRHQDKFFLSSPPGSVSRHRPLGYLSIPHESLSTTSCQSFRMELQIAPRDALTHAWPHVFDAVVRYSTICKALVPPSYLHLPIIARVTRVHLQYSLRHFNEHHVSCHESVQLSIARSLFSLSPWTMLRLGSAIAVLIRPSLYLK